MRTLLAIVVAAAILPGPPATAQTPCTSDAQCADSSPCTIDTCDPLLGCQHGAVPNGTLCSDGNACNGNEVCREGVCHDVTPPADGASCNLGNPCTNGDHCQGGICVAGTIRPDGAGCTDGDTCNGRETCQQGVCTPGAPPADGTPCGDAEPCNGVDTCQNGACVIGPPLPEGSACSDGFVCNGGETCRSGVCTAGPRPPDGTSCSDGKPCNGHETCAEGICRGGSPHDCDDGNPCTNDNCSSAAGGCTHPVRSDGANCSDGNVCNGPETCQGGQCTPGTPPPQGDLCEDGNPCNGVEFCQNQTCVPGTPRPDGWTCADGDLCNGLERCTGGVCRAGTPFDCDDGNPCTVDSCHPASGCQIAFAPNGTSCGDHNACNGAETCHDGGCAPGPPPVCGNLVCDPFAGCVVDTVITGRKLVLRLARRGSSIHRLKVQTREQIFTSTPPSAGTAADPVLHGGVVRLRSLRGGFDQRFELPRRNWDYIKQPEDNRGFRYRERTRDPAIRSVVVRDGRLTKIVGNAASELTSLANDPGPVEVSLILGNQRYCMAFGGDVSFDPERRFIAIDAPAPGACPP